jgi:hypothetical protein
MEPKQTQKLSREEFEKITAELTSLIGDKLKGHKDGDAEKLLFRKRRSGSNASH